MCRGALGAMVFLAASTFAGSESYGLKIDNAMANPAPLVFSTYFGGSSTDIASAVAVDTGGNTYITGWTASTDLPVRNAFQSHSGGGVDAFVAKFDPAGALVYCTYLGGAGDDRAFGIAVDAAGAVYLTGQTASTDFPTAGNPHQSSLAGGSNAFVAKLSATGGSLIYSTFLGGSSSDQGQAIALDASGDAFIAGQTTSSNFPTLHPLQATLKGPQDAFVAEVNGSGVLLFSTYLGGSGTDSAAAIAVGGDGALYLTGATDSVDFPTLNALQPVNGGYQDAFVTKLSSNGAAIVFSTYLGGSGGSVGYPESGLAIDVDANGNAYVAGVTSSSDFPTRNAFQPALAGWVDAFVAKVDVTGAALDFSTYLGGSSLGYGVALRVDSSGSACVAGYSTSPDFPLSNPVQSGSAGSYDAFLSCLTASGQALISSTLLGGSNSDAAYGLAMDAGFVYLAGLSASSDFPLKNPSQSLNTNGKISAFVTKLTRYQGSLPAAPVPTFPANGAVNVSLSPTLTWDASSGADSYDVYFGSSPSPPLLANTTSLAYSPGALGAGTTYYWQVAGDNSAGSSSSAVLSFTTACTYGISPTSAAPGPGASTGSVTVVTTAGCPWTASSGSSSWLTITSGSSGSGNGTVNYAVTANPGATLRTGTLTIAGQTFTVTQTDVNSPALRFVPMTPCRVVDTRNSTGPFGAPTIAGGGSRDFNIPGSACSVPSTAQAYSLNVAVVPAGTLGYLTLWPTGQTQPYVSTLNSLDGRIKSNAAIVPAGTGGSISAFASNATDVILDINGYFVPATDPTALAFYPVTPCRIADTRNVSGPLGGPSLGGGQSRTFPIQSSACGLPATAQAYSLNFAAAPSGPLGYLTAWPAGQTMPLAASLNAPTGTVVANAAIVPAGTGGSIDVFASNPTDLVIDINGYFAPMATGGLSLYGVTPCRVVDTRQPPGSPPITSLDVAVSASACGIPATAQADVLSVAVVPPGTLGYMTLWPEGQTMPVVSTLNALDAAVTSNLAIVPTINGSISVFPSNPTHVIMDISEYFGQ